MGRKRPETNRSKIAKMLIEEYVCKTAGDIQAVSIVGEKLGKVINVF
ncbi:hypothetical protein [Senegalia sp. (in: firmicutes)]